MKRLKTILGVTLLEIMLVLAIASMVIVMSIKYYQSASINQKVNAAAEAVTAVIAAAESYLSSKGTFSGYGSSVVIGYLPGGVMPASPWGGVLATASAGANKYTITVPNIGVGACTPLTNMLTQNTKITATGACTAGSVSSLTVTVTE